jgi:N-acetylglucosamine kinase-like BadF-type ATPase
VYQRQTDRDWLASLSQHVFAAAEQGDSVASQILAKAACDLADLFRSVATRLELDSSQPIPVALAGGVLCSWHRMRESLQMAISEVCEGAVDFQLVETPVRGAVKLARGRCPEATDFVNHDVQLS